jgi:lipoprotein-releasing system permease protein
VYKFLLCWRYLLTRYLALACVVSVMLGVATLIVVNSVMGGFSTKLKQRLHGLLSDVLIESFSIEGFSDPAGKMERIRRDPFLRDRIAAMTPTQEVFAMLQFEYNGEPFTRPVHLIGIDPTGRARVGGFAEYLVAQKNQPEPTFALSPEARRNYEEQNRLASPTVNIPLHNTAPGEPPPPAPPPSTLKIPQGIIVGNAIASFRSRQTKPGEPTRDIYVLNPGDSVVLTTVGGQRLAPVFDRFVVCDYFNSEMSEYDANYVFVCLDYLQHLRTMEDRVTSIQIRLNDYQDADAVVKRLQELFPSTLYHVETWEDKQGPLLAAIDIERGILNVLLFLIICVAGFGILAIFAMIVVEKTRDIGILKALGASNAGVMNIFLGYGLLLGVVGAGLGTLLGVLFTVNINAIEKLLGRLTGLVIFNRGVYYFDAIPTDIRLHSILLVNLGAIAIAVLFSVLPALRAALLHPVRALRYE